MEFLEFAEYVRDNVKDYLPGEYRDAEVRLNEVTRINDEYLGLVVRRDGDRVARNFNLNQLFADYEEGKPMGDIMRTVSEQAQLPCPEPNIPDITEYESVKPFLFFRVGGLEKNRELLKSVPYTTKADMAITYHVDLPYFEDGASFMVTNEMMRNWNIRPEKLHEDALKNCEQMRPAKVMNMNEMLSVMMGPEAMYDVPPSPLIVCTNDIGAYGAAALFYHGMMDQLSEQLESSFYVLPSSIHEVLLLRDEDALDVSSLKNMVTDINATQVDPQDRLTDEVYHYDGKERLFEKADVYIARMERVEQMHSPSITFYATTDLDHPLDGDTKRNLTLVEAFEAYSVMDAVSSKVRGIGFELRDGSRYAMPFPLMEENRVLTEDIERVPHFKDSPLVQKAVKDVKEMLGPREIVQNRQHGKSRSDKTI